MLCNGTDSSNVVDEQSVWLIKRICDRKRDDVEAADVEIKRCAHRTIVDACTNDELVVHVLGEHA